MKRISVFTLTVVYLLRPYGQQISWGASGTWTGTTDSFWATTTNWTASPVPGTGDIATFDSAGGALDVINLGTGVTISSLVFDTAAADAYTIGSGGTNTQTLTINNGGDVTLNAAVANNQLVNAAVVLGTDATLQAYTFTNNSATNGLTFAGNITGGSGGTAGTKTLTVNGSGNTTISGVIANGGASAVALTKSGSGNLYLAGRNTYTGATIINTGGAIVVQDPTGLGSTSSVTVNSGGALQLDGSFNLAPALTLNGSGVSNTGALRNISGVGKYNGNITLGSATRMNSDGGILRVFGTINTAGNTLTVGGVGDTSLWGVISGGGSLNMDGGGFLNLGTVNTYTGGTNLNNGIVFLSTNTALGSSGTISFGGGALQYSGSSNVDYSSRFSTAASQPIKIDTSSQSITFATGLNSPGGSLAVSGQGTLALTAVGSRTGVTLVKDTATLALNLSTAAADNVVSSSSALTLGGNLSVIGTGGTTVRTQAFNGTTFDRGNATITPTLATTSSTANVLTVNLGTLSRNAGGTSTIVFTTGNTTTTNTQITTGTGSANGLITDSNGGAYLTFGTSSTVIRDWAVKDATNTQIVQAPAVGFYTAATATTIAGQADIGALNPTITGAGTDIPVASIRFDNASARTLTLNNTGSTYSIGGILVTSNVAGNQTIIAGDAILQGSNGGVGDFVIHNWGGVSNSARIDAVVGGTGGFTKAGNGRVILAADNSYTGPTTIGGGTLQVGNGGTSGNLGGSTGTIVNNGTLEINRSVASGTLTIANDISGSGGLTHSGAGTTVLQGILSYRGLTTVNAGILTFDTGSRRRFTSRGNSPTSSNRGMDGDGLQINANGTVILKSLFDAETTFVSGGVLNVQSGGELVTRNGIGNGVYGFSIGASEGAPSATYGMLNVTGGSVSAMNDVNAPGQTSPRFTVGTNGTSLGGLLRVSGGVVQAMNLLAERAEITQLGGSIRTAGGNAPNLNTNNGNANTSSATTVLNVAGGSFDNGTLGINVGGGTAGSAKVVINVNAGTLWTQAFTQGTGSQSILNFNGGVLKVGAASTTFTPTPISSTTSTFTSYLNGAFGTYAGGATLDTNGFDITVQSNLLVPTGNGISSLPVATGGAGYAGAPLVTIADAGISQTGTTTANSATVAMTNTTNVFVGQSVTGTGIPLGAIVTAVVANTSITISQAATAPGSPALTFKGQGATAYATISGGQVDGIVITNPGVGYVGTLTAALSGGTVTGGTAATVGTIGTTANSSGGLTKNGAGILTLTGSTTFTGSTVLNTGRLAFGSTNRNTYPSSISGAGGITQSGAGVTIVTGTNTQFGQTSVTAGALQIANLATNLSSNSNLSLAGGVLQLDGGLTFNLNLGTGPGQVQLGNNGGFSATGNTGVVQLNGGTGVVAWGVTTGFTPAGSQLAFGSTTADSLIDFQNGIDLGGGATRNMTVTRGLGGEGAKLSGVLSFTSANAGLQKNGNGQLLLAANNTYSGPTVVNGGTLRSSNSGALPSGTAVTVTGTGAGQTSILDINGNSTTIGTLTLGGSTASSAALVLTGTGTLTLGGDVTFANGNNPLGAVIRGNLGLGAATRTMTVNDSTSTSYELEIAANIAGSGGLTKAAAGTLLLTGANSYSGLTTASVGTLTIGKRTALYNDVASNWTTTNIAVNSGAVLALGVGANGGGYFAATDIDTLLDASHLGASTPTAGLKTGSVIGFETTNATGGAFTYNSVISNPGTALTVGVAKFGAGTLTLSGNSTYTGTTTVNQGLLILSGTNTGTGTVTVSGGVLRANDGTGLNTGSVLTINGGVFETGANLARTAGAATGNMQITGGNSGFSANGGAVQIAFGTLGSPTALTWGSGSFLPATFILNGPTATHAIEFKNAIAFGTTARTIQVDANVATMSGVISNTGTLTKTGNGTLVLSGANGSYTAGLTVSAGTLTIANAIGSTSATAVGGTLKIDAGAGGSLPTTATLSLGTAAGPGAFNYDNTNATGAKSQTLASLTAPNQQPNDNVVQVTRTAAQQVSLVFTAVTSNTTENGNVINFITQDTAGGGVNGTDYKIVLGSGTSATQGTVGVNAYQTIINQNAYFNGGDFAVYDISAGTGLSGFVRGVKYGVDANSATFAAGPITTTNNAQITGNITGQSSVTLGGTASGTNGTLKINGAFNLTMNAGQTLTIQGSGNSGVDGVLKTGGGTSVISGGTALFLPNTQGDIRVDTATDVLQIAMPLTFNAPTRLTKSGAGNLILSGGTLGMTDSRNVFWINGGTVEIAGAATLNDSAGPFNIGRGATLKHNSSSTTSLIAATANGLGGIAVTAGMLTVNSANGFTGGTTVTGGTLSVNNTSGSGTGTGSVTVSGTGKLTGAGIISGAVAISAGTLAPGNGVGSLTLGNGLTLATGATYDWEHFTGNSHNTGIGTFDFVNITGGAVSIDSTPTAGSKLRLLYAATTDFSNTFWDANRSWNIITGGVGGTNVFDSTNITVFVNNIQQGTDNSITGQGTFTTTVTGSDLQLVWTAAAAGPLFAGSGTWKNGSGDFLWTTNTGANNNWITGYPSAAGHIATFDTTAPGGTILLDGNKTLGKLVLNNGANSYTIGFSPGLDTINFDNTTGTGNAAVTNTAGSHTINAILKTTAASDLNITVTAGTLTLAGGVDNTAGKTVTVANSGVLNLNGNSAVSNVSGTGTLTLDANIAVSANRVRQGTLALNGSSGSPTGKLTINQSASTPAAVGDPTMVSQVTILNITSDGAGVVAAAPVSPYTGSQQTYYATLDLKNNDLIVTSGNLALITDEIRSGSKGSGTFPAPAWNGTGITSSFVPSVAGTALGVINNVANPVTNIGGPYYATFDGQSLTGNEILVKYTWYGDLDLDGQVTSFDFALLDAGFAGTKQSDNSYGWFFGDVNYDGQVNSFDYSLALVGYNNYSGAGNLALPEPHSVALAAWIGLGLAVIRLRNSSSFGELLNRAAGNPVRINATKSASNDLPDPRTFASIRNRGAGPSNACRAKTVSRNAIQVA